MTNRAAEHHIETLRKHGAMINAGDEAITLTVEFYRNAVESCEKGGFNAVTYDLILPGIEEPLMLAVWRDGHVDSGSMKNVCACLDR